MAATVLVVDNNVEMHRLYQAALASDFVVLSTAGGAEALKIVTAQPVDVVVTEIVMPDFDGIELLREMKTRFPSVKVICMSGGSMHLTPAFLTKLALRLGAADVLIKPFPMASLCETVKATLAGTEPTKTTREIG